MSGRGNTRGRGRGRGKSQSPSNASEILEAPTVDALDVDFTPPETNQTERTRKHRAPQRSVEELIRKMEVIKRSIIMVSDNLAENDDGASLKRSVTIALKHLKQIEEMCN